MSRSAQVSPPLPLPFGFTLLPSRLPGGQLTPLLYTEVNGLPAYLTICPSHAPHLSLLSILLALRIPATPLQLLIEYGLSAQEYSLDVNGVAPWVDLWTPLDTARRILRDVGAARMFWDAGGRGMLGKVADAVSWHEGDGWYHNWLPSKTHLPESSYSLDALLANSWLFIEVIPDDRCVFTLSGNARTARLISDGTSTDHSKIRGGSWAAVWDHLLGWAIQAWSQYQLHPSHLSSPRKRRRAYPVVELANALPTLFGEPSSKATITLASSDFLRLLPASTIAPSIPILALRLAGAMYRQLETFVPVLRHVTPASWQSGHVNEEETQWLARLNLALCALVSDVILSIWRLRRENDRLRAALASKGDRLPADIAISALPASKGKAQGRRSTSESSSEELDVLIQLERRRGGSPPPPVTSTPSQSGRKGKGRAVPKRHSQSTLRSHRHGSSSSSESAMKRSRSTKSRRPNRAKVVSSPSELSSSSKHPSTSPLREDTVATSGKAAESKPSPQPGRNRRDPAVADPTSTHAVPPGPSLPEHPDVESPYDDPDTKPSSASERHTNETPSETASEEADSSFVSTTTDSSSLSSASPDFLSFPTMLFSISAVLAAVMILFLSGPRY